MTSIKQEIVKGVFWIGLAKYSGIFISLGTTAVLARNISPELFGTMAIATIIMAFLDIFTDMGIGTAIIQFKSLTKEQINSLFLVGTILGIFLSMILYFASPLLANYYEDKTLVTVCRLLCISLLFNALNVVPNGLMLQKKRFKTIAIRTLSFQITSGCIAIIGALNGWGIYALLVSPLITSVGVFIVNFINYPQNFVAHVDFKVLKCVSGYSVFQFLFSLTNYFSRNLDKLIIGKYFSMSDLGYYDKSYRLMQLPIQNITFVIAPVLHPILSSLQNNKNELANKNRQLSILLSQISFPLGIVLYFCAHEIIWLIFGPQWGQAVPIFQILALSIPLQIILSTSGAPFQAAGKTNHLFLVGLSNTTMTVTGFILAAFCFHSMKSMAWAWDITLLINFCISYIVMYRITFRENATYFFSAFIPQIVNSTIVFLILWLLCNFYNYIICDSIVISLLVKSLLITCLTTVIAKIFNQYNFFTFIYDTLKRAISQIITRNRLKC